MSRIMAIAVIGFAVWVVIQANGGTQRAAQMWTMPNVIYAGVR